MNIDEKLYTVKSVPDRVSHLHPDNGQCIHCDSKACTYVCPAKRPLTQSFKLAKAEIRAAKAKAQGGKK